MEQKFELIAKTFMGLEPVLAKELTQMGANDVEIGRRMVSFTGDKEMMYRANFQLHTAIRILKPIRHFTKRSRRLTGLNIWVPTRPSRSTRLSSLKNSATLSLFRIR